MRNYIPDCYDPVRQEENRQAMADKLWKSLPKCIICGSAIFPGAVYTEAYNKPVCNDCFELLESNFDVVPDD